jgi:hypothetical protein
LKCGDTLTRKSNGNPEDTEACVFWEFHFEEKHTESSFEKRQIPDPNSALEVLYGDLQYGKF